MLSGRRARPADLYTFHDGGVYHLDLSDLLRFGIFVFVFVVTGFPRCYRVQRPTTFCRTVPVRWIDRSVMNRLLRRPGDARILRKSDCGEIFWVLIFCFKGIVSQYGVSECFCFLKAQEI